MLVSIKYLKKNMMKQQESSPFTTARKSFFLYLYADFVIE